MRKNISRREFIVGAAAAWVLTQAGIAAAGMGGCGMGGGGGCGRITVIDPPVSGELALLSPLPNLTSETGVYEVAVEARRAAVGINGKTANLLTCNGKFPGPLIRVSRDKLLRMRFTNSLPNDGATNMLGHPTRVTNIHTHGLHVSPGDNMNGTHSDNMLVALGPGEDTIYEYDLSMHPPGNLNFYHPHIHGTVTDQMWAGMSAPLIIADEVTTLAAFAKKVLVLKNISLVGSEPEPHDSMMDYMHGLEGNTVMVKARSTRGSPSPVAKCSAGGWSMPARPASFVSASRVTRCTWSARTADCSTGPGR